jgi:hypothetical protein
VFAREPRFRCRPLLRVCSHSLFPALASPRFRLAGSGWAVSLMRGCRSYLSFSEKRGGQTEWRERFS